MTYKQLLAAKAEIDAKFLDGKYITKITLQDFNRLAKAEAWLAIVEASDAIDYSKLNVASVKEFEAKYGMCENG